MPALTQDAALAGVCAITAEIFETDPATLGASTRLMTDLPCESIDLLEIAARIARSFAIRVDDDALFLRSLRVRIEEDPASAASDVICRCYPHLGSARAQTLAASLGDPAPLVTLADMAAYVRACSGQQ